jgi:Domain of unknown function (DUF4303)
MFDWPAAVDRLHRISKEQVVRFLAGPDKDDVYGAGLFCDAYDGSVYLVANTERYYRTSLRDFKARFGQTDPEVFRWDIGNWKYPGGLFPSSSAEQQAFDTAWEEYREPLSQIESDDKQGMLEDACVEVLMRLFKEGAFSTAPRLKGLMVLGPVVGQEDVLEKKKRLDSLLQPGLERHQR